MGWRPPCYDIGSGKHLPDPTDDSTCLCGHTWDHLPTAEDWRRHRYGPDQRRTEPTAYDVLRSPSAHHWYSE